ncbi:FAD-dependent oxidoreductase [Bradyrhizobium sp. sBnM-33]|uniref:FAD-dependent oxidoreductase n=1 Tax=Bradyrhizobium sp. sBnM-33 TaxID=2831780 RepID=UPI001BCEEFDB|nr:FAD-dependent oxidoreductase [Bradyrhizobium sp. sBnM-33]WOH48415.1 FAD-dependent oxidoreductase [Bradyrhizobium sp. sBnM-33]
MLAETASFDVLIVGAGPVGLTLALDFASRGINVGIIERRRAGEPPSVKCNHVSARSMEIFRRLNVSQELRNAGLPEDYPNDVSYRTTTLGIEIARIKIPARKYRYSDKSGPDGWWPTPEPPHRINQIFLEPILFQRAASTNGITTFNETAYSGFKEDQSGVTAFATSSSGDEQQFRARFLVGCDGGSSTVRKQIGATFKGDPVVQRVQSTYIEAPDLIGRMAAPPAWAMFSLNPRRSGNVYAIDGKKRWLVHNYLGPNETDFESVDRHASIRTILGVPPDFQYKVLSKEDWIGRRLVADRFRQHRVFICGDASHIWVPYAGYGMNAGIADAENLAWLLAAHLKGWASDAILDAYEAERMPITAQVSHFAMNHAHAMFEQRSAVPDDIEASGPRGDQLREALGKAAYELNVQQYCCAGLNFGYFYANSPIITYDGATAPEYTMGSFTPSTVPGARLPHFWLCEGEAVYDRLGPYYTLVRSDPSVDVAPMLKSAEAHNVPLVLLDVAGGPSELDHKLIIVRSDRHVAWRSNTSPTDSLGLIRTLAGRA